MTLSEARKRTMALRAELAHHDELYYKKAQPEIGDFEYDTLKKELAELEKTFPELAEVGSPTAKVGDDRSEGFARVRHLQAMTTLDNTYDEGELREFHARLAKLLGAEDLAYTVEPKIDGLAVSLTYEKGRFARAVTRGDGEEGDDVTENVRTIRSLPSILETSPVPDLVEIRGEVYLRYEEFERINRLQEEEGLEPYANPRNLAAGTLKLLDPKEVARRKLEIVLYGLGHCEPEVVKSQSAYQDQLKSWGLPTVELWHKARGIEEVCAAIRNLDERRRSFVYGTDGAVVKLDSFEQQKTVGFRGEGQAARKVSPRWACAFKFAPDRAETRVNAITIQVGRTGALTPVAELEPVFLAGTTVKRATLHNADEIARKDVRIGDTVLVEKAGEIIPAVVSVLLEKRTLDCVPYSFPKECPVCHTPATRAEGEVAWRCPNPDCPEKVRRRLTHFASKACLDIDGLGEEVVDLLVGKGLVRSLPDIFLLKKENLLPLKKSGDVWAGNLIAAIAARRTADLWRVIHGLGIPQVGAAAAKDLAALFRSLDDFLATDERALMGINGIGEKTASEILRWVGAPSNRSLVEELQRAGLTPAPPPEPKAGTSAPLSGKTVVLTGTLPTLTREEATKLIEDAGGKVSGSVSKKTSYVLAGEEAGSKLDKARSLGIPIIREEDFRKIIFK